MDAASWHRVGDSDMLPEGLLTTVYAGGKAICLVRFEGRYYALDNICPHEEGSLGEGYLEDGYVVCPVHGWQFSPRDGSMPAYYLEPPTTTYPVEERDGGIFVRC